MHTTAATAARALDLPIDETLILASADTRLLAAAARSEVDLNALAREALASRGLDHAGRWVGFARAAEISRAAAAH